MCSGISLFCGNLLGRADVVIYISEHCRERRTLKEFSKDIWIDTNEEPFFSCPGKKISTARILLYASDMAHQKAMLDINHGGGMVRSNWLEILCAVLYC